MYLLTYQPYVGRPRKTEHSNLEQLLTALINCGLDTYTLQDAQHQAELLKPGEFHGGFIPGLKCTYTIARNSDMDSAEFTGPINPCVDAPVEYKVTQAASISYRVRNPKTGIGWADITIIPGPDEITARLQISSDYGTWATGFNGLPTGIKSFLCKMNNIHYLAEKLKVCSDDEPMPSLFMQFYTGPWQAFIKQLFTELNQPQ